MGSALALLAMTALTACATGASPDSSSGLPIGRTFLSTAVTENGAPKPLVAGTRIQLTFDAGGMVAATAGCNTMAGPSSLRNGALVIDDNHLGMTLMGCLTGGLGEQDAWLRTFLTGSPGLHLDGDQLTLTGPTITVTFLDRRVADPDRPLTGTRWSVDTVSNGNVASSVQSDAPAELVIDSAGTFDMTTGCVGGELRGTASVQDSMVTFTVTTKQPCTGPSTTLDSAVRSVISGRVGYAMSGRSLRLNGPGDVALGLHANEG
jgi:heat shock protein HslJ